MIQLKDLYQKYFLHYDTYPQHWTHMLIEDRFSNFFREQSCTAATRSEGSDEIYPIASSFRSIGVTSFRSIGVTLGDGCAGSRLTLASLPTTWTMRCGVPAFADLLFTHGRRRWGALRRLALLSSVVAAAAFRDHVPHPVDVLPIAFQCCRLVAT